MAEQQMTKEQMEELKEKLSKMSPEELKEFQKKQCIFCHIISGKVQAKKVYDDDKCIAILDINPANPGHVLLLPKEHYSIMPQVPEEEIKYMAMVAKAISNKELRALEASGTNLLIANGPAAGQKAQHFMIHIIPRKENDGITFSVPQKKIDEKSLTQIRQIIAKKMGFEIKGEKKEETKQGKRIVEAEIKEELEEPKKESKNNINLDDIARILGVK